MGIQPSGTAWFADPAVVENLPPAYRWYARYARLVGDSDTGVVRGGTVVHRIAAGVTRTLGLRDSALISARNLQFAVDLLDLRMVAAMDEVRRDNPDLSILAGCLSPGGTFLDIGANHGSYAIQMAPVVGPEGRVIAFEPQPRLAALLRSSFAANRFSHAAVHEVVCGEKAGERLFYVPARHSGSASLYRDFLGAGPTRRLIVRECRLDEVMASEGVTGRVAVKVDVEGAEVSVILGGLQFLRAHRPSMLLEINAESLSAAGRSLRDLIAALKAAGYSRVSELGVWPETAPLSELRPEPQRNVVVTAGK